MKSDDGFIIDSFGKHPIQSGIENRIRFILRPFNYHPLFESVVKELLREFRIK